MQKPFWRSALIDKIEDKDIYQRLQKFNVDIDIIKAVESIRKTTENSEEKLTAMMAEQ